MTDTPLATRRGFLAGFAASGAALLAGPAFARGGYVIADARVSLSSIVRSRTITNMGAAIAANLRGRGSRGGRPAVLDVRLHTIDPYRAGAPGRARGIAVRYTLRDSATGRVVKQSRFIARTPSRNELARFQRVFPRTRAASERELVRRVTNSLLRAV